MANEPTPQNKPAPPPAYRWLLNNTSRVLIFALPPAKHAASGTVTHDMAPLMLPIGAVLVDGKKWAALRAAEKAAADKAKESGLDAANEIERLLTTKIPRATHSKRPVENSGEYHLVEGPGVASKSDPLNGIDDGKAADIAREIQDLAVLNAILAVEKRGPVVEALRKQREELNRGARAVA